MRVCVCVYIYIHRYNLFMYACDVCDHLFVCMICVFVYVVSVYVSVCVKCICVCVMCVFSACVLLTCHVQEQLTVISSQVVAYVCRDSVDAGVCVHVSV